MSEKLAWEKFERTGSIENYLKYREMCDRNTLISSKDISVLKGDSIGEIIQSEGNSN